MTSHVSGNRRILPHDHVDRYQQNLLCPWRLGVLAVSSFSRRLQRQRRDEVEIARFRDRMNRMNRVSLAELRQNPSDIIDAVTRGQTHVVTLHQREVARIVPPLRHPGVTPCDFAAMMAGAPVDPDWGTELIHMREEDTAVDPWEV